MNKIGILCSLGGDNRKVEKLLRRLKIDVSKRFEVLPSASEAECDAAINNALNRCKESKFVTHLIIAMPGFPTELTNAPYSSGLGDFLDTGKIPRTLENSTLNIPSPLYMTQAQRDAIRRVLASIGITVIFV